MALVGKKVYTARKKLMYNFINFCFKRKESNSIGIIQGNFLYKVSYFPHPSLFMAYRERHNLCINRALLDHELSDCVT